MPANNRSNKIAKLVSSLKKHFKPSPASKDRTLLENLVFACLLEDSPHDAAEAAFAGLQSHYFDWNEVRVSTRRELADELKNLADPAAAADRLKRTLQSVFEGVYTFDLEHLKKQNLGQTVKQLQSYKGVTPFAIAYVTQTSLGGHSIPVNSGLYTAFVTLEITTAAEADAGSAPGLERAIPKSKGVEVASLLHQLGVEVGKNPYGQNARKILLALDPACKDRLPKRPAPRDPKAAPTPSPATQPSAAKPTTQPSAAKPATKPSAAKTPAADEAPPAPPAAKKASGKTEKKPATKKSPPPGRASAAPKKKAPKKAPSPPAKKTTAKKVAKKTTAKRKPK